MKYLLPPLHTLRAFEAIARLHSFTKAAHELHLTHSAISHQIRTLEEFFEIRLIDRTRRSVALTPAGERLVSVVRCTLEQLTEISMSIRRLDAPRLSVSVLPSFAGRWLLPRLGLFLQQHPDIDVQLYATQTLVDLDTAGVDVAIRYGNGNWPGVRSERLFDEEVYPVASPSFIKNHAIRRSQDLQNCPLLRDEFQPWEPWLNRVGIDPESCSFGALYGDSALTLQSAEIGQGVALARSWLVADALKAGTLSRIGRVSIPAKGAYFLVFPTHQTTSLEISLFCNWVRTIAGYVD